jgi:hypothetical protein
VVEFCVVALESRLVCDISQTRKTYAQRVAVFDTIFCGLVDTAMGPPEGGGAINCRTDVYISIGDCSFWSCTSSYSGGAILLVTSATTGLWALCGRECNATSSGGFARLGCSGAGSIFEELSVSRCGTQRDGGGALFMKCDNSAAGTLQDVNTTACATTGSGSGIYDFATLAIRLLFTAWEGAATCGSDAAFAIWD